MYSCIFDPCEFKWNLWTHGHAYKHDHYVLYVLLIFPLSSQTGRKEGHGPASGFLLRADTSCVCTRHKCILTSSDLAACNTEDWKVFHILIYGTPIDSHTIYLPFLLPILPYSLWFAGCCVVTQIPRIPFPELWDKATEHPKTVTHAICLIGVCVCMLICDCHDMS